MAVTIPRSAFAAPATPATLLAGIVLAACVGGQGPNPGATAFSPPFAPAVVPTEPLSADPQAEPGCSDWAGWRFFESASVELVEECLRGGANADDPGQIVPTVFRAALLAADPEVIRLLVEAGADPNARLGPGSWTIGRSGSSPLHTAASQNPNPGIVEALVAAGTDPNTRDDQSATPLHLAWQNPNPAVSRALLRVGADPLARDDRGRVADPTSCMNWNTAAFTRLANLDDFELCLGQGRDLHARNEDGDTPLHLAAAGGNSAAALLLVEGGADIEDRNFVGATPLHLAAAHDRAAIVTELLAAGADVNAVDSAGITPLLASLNPVRRAQRAVDLPLRLLSLGADPNARDSHGRTPLYLAASAGELAVVRALLESGANPFELTNNGSSLLHAAAESPDPEVIAHLASIGVELDRRNDEGHGPLHLAVMESRRNRWDSDRMGLGFAAEEVGEPVMVLRALALLEAGADPGARTPTGDTPLHLASWYPDSILVAALVRAGAEVNVRNNQGETPLHLARAWANRATVRALLGFGADPDARDNAGRIADPVCHWGPEQSGMHAWYFLAASPAESVRGCLASGIPVGERDEEGATFLARMVSALGCCADFENVLREFVAAGADVDARDDAGRTPLHRAIGMAGRLRAHVLATVASALLAAGADPGARDNQGETPLDLALRRNATAIVETLVQLGAESSTGDSAGIAAAPAMCDRWGTQTFFEHASADAVAACLADGSDPRTVVDRFPGAGPLHYAAASTRDPAVIFALLEAGADVHARDGAYARTALHHAALSGDARVVRALLEAGADPNAWATGFSVDWGWSWTPLHLAARHNPDPDVVRALVEGGADLGAPSGETYRMGDTPLHFAARNPNPQVTAALVYAGADVHALSNTGRSPLHAAASYASDPAAIELLVASGAEVNAVDYYGFAPLHSAAWYNLRPEITTALIAFGADIDARDPDGYDPAGRTANHRTPLFMALYRGGAFIAGHPMPVDHNVAVAEALVRAGADLEATDGSGQTALHAAALYTPAAFPLLLSLGANPNARDATGRTPLDYALASRSLEGLPEVRSARDRLQRRR